MEKNTIKFICFSESQDFILLMLDLSFNSSIDISKTIAIIDLIFSIIVLLVILQDFKFFLLGISYIISIIVSSITDRRALAPIFLSSAFSTIASKAVSSTKSSKPKQIISEGTEFANRLKKLAGIK